MKMSKRDKISLTITSVLVVVFIFFANNAYKTVRKAKLQKKERVSLQFSSEAALDKILNPSKNTFSEDGISSFLQFSSLEKVAQDLELMRDPFRPAPVVKSAGSVSERLILNGIIWDPKDPKAVINNTIVEVGDKINGFEVVEIDELKVIVNDGSGGLVLRLGR